MSVRSCDPAPLRASEAGTDPSRGQWLTRGRTGGGGAGLSGSMRMLPRTTALAHQSLSARVIQESKDGKEEKRRRGGEEGREEGLKRVLIKKRRLISWKERPRRSDRGAEQTRSMHGGDARRLPLQAPPSDSCTNPVSVLHQFTFSHDYFEARKSLGKEDCFSPSPTTTHHSPLATLDHLINSWTLLSKSPLLVRRFRTRGRLSPPSPHFTMYPAPRRHPFCFRHRTRALRPLKARRSTSLRSPAPASRRRHRRPRSTRTTAFSPAPSSCWRSLPCVRRSFYFCGIHRLGGGAGAGRKSRDQPSSLARSLTSSFICARPPDFTPQEVTERVTHLYSGPRQLLVREWSRQSSNAQQCLTT